MIAPIREAIIFSFIGSPLRLRGGDIEVCLQTVLQFQSFYKHIAQKEGNDKLDNIHRYERNNAKT